MNSSNKSYDMRESDGNIYRVDWIDGMIYHTTKCKKRSGVKPEELGSIKSNSDINEFLKLKKSEQKETRDREIYDAFLDTDKNSFV